MELDVSEAEAAGELCRVPVCVGCHRRATGVARVRLNAAAGSPGPGPGSGDLLNLVVVLGGMVGEWRRRAASDKAWVGYPACWRHRRLNRPALRLVRATDGHVVLDGVSAEFVAGWEAARRVGDGLAGPGSDGDRDAPR